MTASEDLRKLPPGFGGCNGIAGRPVFRDLLFRRRQCVFIAFDLLYHNGKDLRTFPLIERKAILKKLLRGKRSRILYLDHVEGDGTIAV